MGLLDTNILRLTPTAQTGHITSPVVAAEGGVIGELSVGEGVGVRILRGPRVMQLKDDRGALVVSAHRQAGALSLKQDAYELQDPWGGSLARLAPTTRRTSGGLSGVLVDGTPLAVRDVTPHVTRDDELGHVWLAGTAVAQISPTGEPFSRDRWVSFLPALDQRGRAASLGALLALWLMGFAEDRRDRPAN